MGASRCSAMQHHWKRVILCQRVRGSVRAVRAVRNIRVFQPETSVVADATPIATQAGPGHLTASNLPESDDIDIVSPLWKRPRRSRKNK